MNPALGIFAAVISSVVVSAPADLWAFHLSRSAQQNNKCNYTRQYNAFAGLLKTWSCYRQQAETMITDLV
jgi:hypothetical protein